MPGENLSTYNPENDPFIVTLKAYIKGMEEMLFMTKEVFEIKRKHVQSQIDSVIQAKTK